MKKEKQNNLIIENKFPLNINRIKIYYIYINIYEKAKFFDKKLKL